MLFQLERTARMIQRRFILPMFLGAAAGSVVPLREIHAPGQEQSSQSHVAWVADTLKRMQSINTGMTRKDVLRVFTTEGGLSTGLQRTYVSRDCPYFNVDIEFRAASRPDRDRDGSVTPIEDERDVITKISRPYMAFSVMD